MGRGEAWFAAMGASFRTHSSALEEALDIVRRLLAGETESSSRRFRVTKRGVALRPAEPVEVCIGASTPPAIDAWHGWRSAESPAPVSPVRRRAHRPIFTRALRRLRLHPAAIALRRDIYVGVSLSRHKRCCGRCWIEAIAASRKKL